MIAEGSQGLLSDGTFAVLGEFYEIVKILLSDCRQAGNGFGTVLNRVTVVFGIASQDMFARSGMATENTEGFHREFLIAEAEKAGQEIDGQKIEDLPLPYYMMWCCLCQFPEREILHFVLVTPPR